MPIADLADGIGLATNAYSKKYLPSIPIPIGNRKSEIGNFLYPRRDERLSNRFIGAAVFLHQLNIQAKRLQLAHQHVE
jgi:hypothetical protein